MSKMWLQCGGLPARHRRATGRYRWTSHRPRGRQTSLSATSAVRRVPYVCIGLARVDRLLLFFGASHRTSVSQHGEEERAQQLAYLSTPNVLHLVVLRISRCSYREQDIWLSHRSSSSPMPPSVPRHLHCTCWILCGQKRLNGFFLPLCVSCHSVVVVRCVCLSLPFLVDTCSRALHVAEPPPQVPQVYGGCLPLLLQRQKGELRKIWIGCCGLLNCCRRPAHEPKHNYPTKHTRTYKHTRLGLDGSGWPMRAQVRKTTRVPPSQERALKRTSCAHALAQRHPRPPQPPVTVYARQDTARNSRCRWFLLVSRGRCRGL